MELLLVLLVWLALCCVSAILFVAVVRGGRGSDLLDEVEPGAGPEVEAPLPSMRTPTPDETTARPTSICREG